MFPVLYPAFDWLNVTFPGLVHQCPYTVSLKLANWTKSKIESFAVFKELKIVNASIILGMDTKIMTRSALSLPNGNYKYKIKYHDEIDDHIGSANILLVIRERSRDVEFWLTEVREA